ncbi:sporulation sigma factor-processing peptidase [Alkalicoccobacillus gibsonii]|uniref:sporulation sigma factor-processing peptidase n=1 Tax=Alkalicoccobacillus gibsonii TaxID=79881 RepID=UPI00193140AF|nr:sporulation sigma factor-processing peptidase [Alkalicoccobacillus gibsonii]MBM0064970.1 sporulation sigma factor-processing peptidase [Alkalicoccobacillus gibsonii]
MTNTLQKNRLYSPSAIGTILKIARERARKDERRTKQFMADSLGISLPRLTRFEDGQSQIPFEMALEWCDICEDYTAKAKIKHIYGLDLPATDPRLLESVTDQLVNFMRQAQQAIDSAKDLLIMGTQIRPGEPASERFISEMYKHAEEILDMKQATESTLQSMSINWELDRQRLRGSWIQEALADKVVIASVSAYEEIKLTEFHHNRIQSL